MKRVNQTKFGRPDGNCFEACLASILELPLEAVPRYTGDDWLERINQWLRWHYSLQLIIAQPDILDAGMAPDTYVIANGQNHQGVRHSVVHRGTTLVHDPNPSNGGLAITQEVLVFVAINPARMKRRKERAGTV